MELTASCRAYRWAAWAIWLLGRQLGSRAPRPLPKLLGIKSRGPREAQRRNLTQDSNADSIQAFRVAALRQLRRQLRKPAGKTPASLRDAAEQGPGPRDAP